MKAPRHQQRWSPLVFVSAQFPLAHKMVQRGRVSGSKGSQHAVTEMEEISPTHRHQRRGEGDSDETF